MSSDFKKGKVDPHATTAPLYIAVILCNISSTYSNLILRESSTQPKIKIFRIIYDFKTNVRTYLSRLFLKKLSSLLKFV